MIPEQGPSGEHGQYGKIQLAKPTQIVLEETLLRLLLQGFTIKEAAQQARKSYQTCLRVARQPEFVLRLQEMSAEIGRRCVEEMSTNAIDFAKKLEEASEHALEAMMEMMNETPTGVLKYKIAQDLMDRDARSSKTKKLDVSNTHKHEFINPDVLMHAAGVANELVARASGTASTRTDVIDVVPDESGGKADPPAGGAG